MECVRGIAAVMACAEYGDLVGVFLHIIECDMFGDFHAGFGGTGMFGVIVSEGYC